jgi:hypothetical protein
VLLAAFSAVALHALVTVEQTQDERYYLSAARELVTGEGWSNPLANQQPPLGLYASGLLTRSLPPEQVGDVIPAHARTLGRLGIFAGGLLCAVIAWLWARRALGRSAGRLLLLLFAGFPILAGYSGLVTVDMWHAAMLVLTGFALWRAGLQPRPSRMALLGIALGLCLATKYTAMFHVPTVLLLAGAAAWRGQLVRSDPAAAPAPAASRGAAARRALLAPLLAGAVGLVTLHACYGFSAELAGFDSGFEWTRRLPLLAPLAAPLPRPFVQGVQLAFDLSSDPHRIFLNGRFATGHVDYYLWALLLKTPLAILALLLLALATRARAWLDGSAAPGERALALVCALLIVPTLVGMSFGTSFQLGIRYVLQVVPLLLLLASTVACWPRLVAAPRGVRVAAASLVAGALAVETVGARNDPIAYYNALGGGQARAYRHFTDSNSDWTQGCGCGMEWLALREGPPIERLHPGDGPRLGRVAVYVRDIAPQDPDDPARSRHWLDVFEPEQHFRAAFYVFTVTPQAFEAAARASADPRVLADYAVALAAADRVGKAKAACADLPAGLRQPIETALRLSRPPAAGAARTAAEVEALVSAWMELHRPDLAIAASRVVAASDASPALRYALGLAHLRQEQPDRAVAVLEAVPQEALTPRELLLLLQAHLQCGHTLVALDIMQANANRLHAAVPRQAELTLRMLQRAAALLPEWVKELQEQPPESTDRARSPLPAGQ